jgi:hypothetical protein
MLLDSDTADLAHARGAVGAEDESENFRNPVIEHPAVLGILKILALGAGCKLVAYATFPHLAPGGLVIFPASRASAAQICPACTAVQAAAGDKLGVGPNLFHCVSPVPIFSS